MSRTTDMIFTLDEYLSSKKSKTFTQAELVEVFGLHPKDASGLIQQFLRTQKTDEGDLKNRVYRVPGTRTSNAIWTHGSSVRDVRRVVAQAADDVKTRSDELADFLESVQVKNSHAAKAISQANLLLSTAVSVLEHAEF